jgi:adenylylsulfate kinase-like enzyme
MRLYDNWQQILRKAWSVRLMVLAGILSGCEIILPFYAEHFPRNIFAALSFAAVFAALIARIVAQREVE